jgi:drug/metabolite transporter (DMT)-like permease
MLDSPIARGSVVAIAAAVLFGATTPLVRLFGGGVGAFATATLLYAGAAGAAGLRSRTAGEPRLGRAQRRRIAIVAVFGAALAPASLAWGLQHTGALAASLLLNMEAVFTVLLARAFYREPIGGPVAWAVALMVAGGALLGLRSAAGGPSSALGLAAIVGATLGWALDNTLTRPLADYDPRAVVRVKAVGGALLSAAMALVLRDPWPSPGPALALLACGATGYGLSLRLYLRAQRSLGAARTGSLFAFAPFVGAALAFALGDRENLLLVAAAGALFGVAVYLHATERHHHLHRHDAVEHEHAHRHDDGHHAHVHELPVAGEHSHLHRHEATEHDHPHGVDLHHRHDHE